MWKSHARVHARTHTHTNSPLQSLPTYPGGQIHTPSVQFPLTHTGTQSLTVEGERVGGSGYTMYHCNDLIGDEV